MKLPGAFGYHETGYDNVQGWFWPEDFDFFDRLLAQQLEVDTQGDILEIGCYHGKSAILMGYGLRSHEELVVCDLFGAPVNTAERTDVFEEGFGLSTFKTNYSKFHEKEPVIHACSSLELDLTSQQFRFIHVDGGHAEEVASFDIETAVTYATPRAIIAIDDYRTHHTPGVGAAIWAAAVSGGIFPFCLSENKVYAAATGDDHDYWLDVCRGFNFPHGEEHLIFGETVLRTTRGAMCGS